MKILQNDMIIEANNFRELVNWYENSDNPIPYELIRPQLTEQAYDALMFLCH